MRMQIDISCRHRQKYVLGICGPQYLFLRAWNSIHLSKMCRENESYQTSKFAKFHMSVIDKEIWIFLQSFHLFLLTIDEYGVDKDKYFWKLWYQNMTEYWISYISYCTITDFLLNAEKNERNVEFEIGISIFQVTAYRHFVSVEVHFYLLFLFISFITSVNLGFYWNSDKVLMCGIARNKSFFISLFIW